MNIRDAIDGTFPWQNVPMGSSFFERVVEAFETAGLESTQSAIARQLDIGQSAVAKWAHGNGYPTTRKIIAIARLTGVSIEWLLTGRGNKKPGGAEMDDLTQALLEYWVALPGSARDELMAFLMFLAAKASIPTPTSKDQPEKKSN